MSTTWTAPRDTNADALIDAMRAQDAAAITLVSQVTSLRQSDPQAWLFAERTRYLQAGACDPYAEQLLRQAGFLGSS